MPESASYRGAWIALGAGVLAVLLIGGWGGARLYGSYRDALAAEPWPDDEPALGEEAWAALTSRLDAFLAGEADAVELNTAALSMLARQLFEQAPASCRIRPALHEGRAALHACLSLPAMGGAPDDSDRFLNLDAIIELEARDDGLHWWVGPVRIGEALRSEETRAGAGRSGGRFGDAPPSGGLRRRLQNGLQSLVGERTQELCRRVRDVGVEVHADRLVLLRR